MKNEQRKYMKCEINIEDNCFDWIRIFCALIVFFGHFLADYQVESPFLLDIAYFVRGVPVFFGLSGFLVARSVERYHPKQFFVKRFIRIYPAMWACIAVNTALILLFYSTHPTIKELFIYVGTQLTVFQFYTGGWLRGYGVGVPNGALWTITVDIQFYLAAYFLVKWLKNRPLRNYIEIIFISGGVSLLIEFFRGYIPPIIYKICKVSILPFLYIFLFGMMVYFFRQRFLPVFHSLKWVFITVYILWSMLPEKYIDVFQGVRYNFVTTLLLLCAVFSIGYGFGKHRFKTDYSYAFYLWHIVVINFVYHHLVKKLGVNFAMLGWMTVEIFVIGLIAWGTVQLIDKRLCPVLQDKLLKKL